MTPAELAELPKVVAELKRLLDALPQATTGESRFQAWCDLRDGLVRHSDSLLAAAEECERLRAALRRLVEDGECYCADGVAAHGPCGHCKARAALEGKT